VMIVQAGAARQVLADAPGEARAALLAVESSGREAMAELRHLLGLLSPPPPGDGAGEDEGGRQAGQELRPQPGLGQLHALIGRVSATGLPVELHASDVPRDLPPGLDLTAFRVIQEALTNVIKHAGKPRTSVSVEYHADNLVVEVADTGQPAGTAGPVALHAGRGLLGLRERAALYGGELDAGPRPGGGWLVRARIPVGPLPACSPGPEPAAACNPAPAPAEP
jgi:signal transduction histidine kinase